MHIEMRPTTLLSEYTNTEIKQQHDIMKKYWEVHRLGKNLSPRWDLNPRP